MSNDFDSFDEEEDFDPPYDDEEDEQTGSGYTVAMKGFPNMAQVSWAATEEKALADTARAWGCSIDRVYIYRGQDE